MGSHPELQAPYRLQPPVIGTVQIPLRGPNMGMPHQRLHGFQVVSVIHEGRGERMAHRVGMDTFLD